MPHRPVKSTNFACPPINLKLNQRIFLHLGFWLAYVLYDGYLSAPLSGSSFEGLTMWERFGMAYWGQLCLLVVKVPAVYLVLYRFFPERFEGRDILFFCLKIVGLAFVVTACTHFIWYDYLFPFVYKIDAPGPPSNGWVLLFRWLYNSLDIFFLIGITTALKLFRLRQKSATRERELMEEKLQSELKFLRSQTNPHFLFNTLNNLYHLARKNHENTPEAILKLSGLLRFMLYECGSGAILLTKEVQVIRDYIELEKLRYNERLRLDFKVEIKNEEAQIAPLLLLPLVENAFKHGASESTGETSVEIELREKTGHLFFRVKNTVDQDAKMEGEGIGLSNVRRQLELQYPEHRLGVNQMEGAFQVEVEIIDNEL